MIRVLLADDQPLMRGGFRALIDAEDDMTVVAEAADGPTAARLAGEFRPDVALLDVEMPGGDGISAVRTIAADERLAELRVVMLTNYSFDAYVFDALRAGAAGYLVKDTEPEELLRCVRAAAAGETLLSPQIAAKLVAEYVAHPPSRLVGPGRGPHLARDRDRRAGRAGADERRDRRAPVHQPGDREDPCAPGDDEARRPRPRGPGGLRLRVGPGAAQGKPVARRFRVPRGRVAGPRSRSARRGAPRSPRFAWRPQSVRSARSPGLRGWSGPGGPLAVAVRVTGHDRVTWRPPGPVLVRPAREDRRYGPRVGGG